MSYDICIQDINWAMLKRQRMTLNKVAYQNDLTGEERDDLVGIQNLLDEMSDIAVKLYGEEVEHVTVRE